VSLPQFTPGPWIADGFCEENEQATRVGTYDGSPTYYHRTATIAFCQTNHDDDKYGDVPTIGIVAAEANARLIAAAPELYEALENVLAKAVQSHDAWDIDDAWRQWEDSRDRAQAALAKARGDQ
jgi:hypothetical protein